MHELIPTDSSFLLMENISQPMHPISNLHPNTHIILFPDLFTYTIHHNSHHHSSCITISKF